MIGMRVHKHREQHLRPTDALHYHPACRRAQLCPQCARSVLRPGLELRLRSTEVPLHRLPLNLLLCFRPQEATSYEVIVSHDFYPVPLVLVFGKNKPSISPRPLTTPKVIADPWGTWEGDQKCV